MNEKQEILIIECMSSGAMYVEEAIERGFKALVVNPNCPDKHMMESKTQTAAEFQAKYGEEDYELINTANDCDAIVKAVEGHNIAAVVVGSEYGVRVADKVAHALEKPWNFPTTTWRRCTKAGMIQSLEQTGLRAIKSTKVKSEDDIVNFWKENDIDKAFMKFSESAAGFANKACNSLSEALAHYEYIKSIPNYFGNDEDDILLQEFIGGDEYVVNTISCNGKHMLSDLWKYTKVTTKRGSVIYQSSRLMTDLDEELQGLVDYTFKVLNAEDFWFGPCHGEFKIDNRGPVLIETNPRPMGDSMTRPYMKNILGHCIVDLALDSVMNRRELEAKIDAGVEYKPLRHAAKKYVILQEHVYGDMEACFTIAENLKTFFEHATYAPQGMKTYPETKDLGDTPMILKLAADTQEDIEYDLAFMNELEEKYPELVVTQQPNLDAGAQRSIDEIVAFIGGGASAEGGEAVAGAAVTKPANSAKRTLVVTDKDAYEVQNGKATPVDETTPKIFDAVLYANAAAGTLGDKVAEIIATLRYLKPGGDASICPAVAQMLPYGAETFEVLKRAVRV